MSKVKSKALSDALKKEQARVRSEHRQFVSRDPRTPGAPRAGASTERPEVSRSDRGDAVGD